MSGSTCPRCEKPKNPEFFACSSCWFMLKSATRNAIYAAWRRDGALTPDWCRAARQAFAEWHMPVPRWLAVMLEGEEAE